MTKRLILLLSLFVLFSGINKIQYKDFDFKFIETEHFKIYYYSGGEKLAEFASFNLEEVFPDFSNFFQIKINYKIPVLIFNSPNDFKQNNVIFEVLPEGVGGFTEIFKKRIVVPFNGSYEEFRHVLVHELTHVFEYELFYGKVGQNLFSGNVPEIPLFVMEGLAEYLSKEEDAETRGFTRDLLINSLLPDLYRFSMSGGYIVYRLGEMFFRFIEEKYGKEKVSEFVRAFVVAKTLERNVKKTFGQNLSRFSDYFRWYLKEKLYDDFKKYDFPHEISEQITVHSEEGGFLNIGCAISPDGSKIAFISDKTGFTDIYITYIGKRKSKKIISGQKNPSLENLHLVRPGLSFSSDGKYLVFITSGGKSDVLFVYDTEREKTVIKRELRELDAGYEPSFSPDESKIVFTGLKDGFSDLYLYNIHTGEIISLMEDKFDDRNPLFINDTLIIFISDRNYEDKLGSYAVFSYNPLKGNFKRLSPYLGKIDDPYLQGDRVYFLYDDPGGLRNLYFYDIKKDSLYRLTNFPTYIHDVSYSKDLSSLSISLLWKGGYDIFVINDISSLKPEKVPLYEGKVIKFKEVDYTHKNYTVTLTPDWVIAGFGYYPLYGYFGGVTLGFSDIPGNWVIEFFTELSQDIINSNWDLRVFYLKQRTDYFFQLYQYFPYYILSERYDALDKDLGTNLFITYPLDIFNRIETGFNIGYRERFLIDYMLERITFETFMVYDYILLYIYDRSFRFYNGSKDGEFFGIGFTKGLSSDYNYYEIQADFRKYFRLTPRSNFASRFLFGQIEGSERVITYFIGSPYMMRGYELFSKWGRDFIYGTLELRIPFLDRLRIGFLPFEIGGIRSVLFTEAILLGKKEDFKNFKLIEKVDGNYKTKDLLMDVGIGFRFDFGYFYLKLDFAKKWDMQKLYGSWQWWLTFGDDF
ncbi:MAG: hypothetical protein ABIN23_02030 [candidate division WOR-3 bacterium]